MVILSKSYALSLMSLSLVIIEDMWVSLEGSAGHLHLWNTSYRLSCLAW